MTVGAVEAVVLEDPVGDDLSVGPPLNRMLIAVLSLVGLLIAGYLLLHKLGFIGTLACGIGNCSKVQLSPWAVFLGIPVPAWGIAGYVTLFGLSLAGLQPRFAGDRRIALGLVAFSAVAFVFSLYLTVLEAFVIHAWCQWCIVSALVATLIFAAALRELPRLRGSGR